MYFFAELRDFLTTLFHLFVYGLSQISVVMFTTDQHFLRIFMTKIRSLTFEPRSFIAACTWLSFPSIAFEEFSNSDESRDSEPVRFFFLTTDVLYVIIKLIQ